MKNVTMKKVLVLLLALALFIPAGLTSAETLRPDSSIKVLLHGKQLKFDINPVQTKGTTLVQFTTIFKALELKYTWDQETKSISGYNDEMSLDLTLNDKIANVNGYNVELNVAPIAYQGKTLVPLRFVSEATGLKVTWNGSTKTITIENNPNPKVVSAPPYYLYTGGAEVGDSMATVKALNPELKAQHPYSNDDFSYFGVDYFGYDAELNFSFIDNKFFAASYYVGKEGLDENYFIAYSDIYEGLVEDFGVPNEEGIYELDPEGYVGEPVDDDIPMQLLIDGIENGEYSAQAHWYLPHVMISLNLYVTIDGNIAIETVFLPIEE